VTEPREPRSQTLSQSSGEWLFNKAECATCLRATSRTQSERQERAPTTRIVQLSAE
jgi:hypothetical protein